MNDQQSKFKRWFADFKEWFLPHWRKFRVRQKAVWKRFQITRWIIAILLTLLLIISVYLTVVAKTAAAASSPLSARSTTAAPATPLNIL